jgi:FkbM family methyltransferase
VTSSGGRLARFFLRYLAPLSGLRRVPVVGACARWVSAKFLPRGSLVWVQVRNGPGLGLWLRLNPRTGHNYYQGIVEPEVQQALAEQLRPGMVFYDIGANLGFFSLLAARLVGPQGKVVAFEAEPDAAARLREHAARNQLTNITVEEVAVWSETGAVAFVRSDPGASPDRGLGHVDPQGGAPDSIAVPAISLDEYAQSPPPDFLKCDVEGAEVRVFRGARRLLAEKRSGILCELHSEENRRILGEELARRGYTCRPCGKDHILALPP